MRQAGRCLPEYRAFKDRYSFLKLVQTPELAAEVTVQPIRRFGFDAAILFSDILVVPQALGQGFDFRESGGVQMEFKINSRSDVAQLTVEGIEEKLAYVTEVLKQTRSLLGKQTALIGFAGSPWTLANFMLEGGSSKEFSRAKTLFYSEPALFNDLMEKLTLAVVRFLQLQIDAGVDAVQIFDTLGGSLAPNAFQAASGRWMKQIVVALERQVPVIVYSKGAHYSLEALEDTRAQVLGFDWTVRLRDMADALPSAIGLQGNLDPAILLCPPEVAGRETSRLLTEMQNRPGHIFNLGHGVPPAANLDSMRAVVDSVQNFPSRLTRLTPTPSFENACSA